MVTTMSEDHGDDKDNEDPSIHCVHYRFIETGKWKPSSTQFKWDWSITEFKRDISRLCYIPTKNFVIRNYRGESCSDESQTLRSYGIVRQKGKNKVDVVFCLSDDGISLQIQTLAGVYKWPAHPSTSLKRIVRQLSSCIDHRFYYGTCIFHGKEIPKKDESKTLADLGLAKDGSRLVVVGTGPRAKKSLATNTSQHYNSIPQAELRGITLHQLQDVAVEIYNRCEAEGWTSTLDGHLLKPQEVNLYDLNHHFIKPSTSKGRCSYVETIATGPQKPIWFVSHWWGEPVIQFVKCLEQHASDRRLPDTAPYWVCGYAINQHKVENELAGSSPKDSPFFKALQCSKGTVSILDQQGVCYNRIWCIFELHLSMLELAYAQTESEKSKSKHLYDVYTVYKQGPSHCAVGITDGIVEQEEKTTDKTFRESAFPLMATRKALGIQVETAQATDPKDRTRILNYIRGESNLDTEVSQISTHQKFHELNALLRGKFAVSGFTRALGEGEDMTEFRTALSQAPLRNLEITFQDVSNFWGEVRQFLHCLPETLEQLELIFKGQDPRNNPTQPSIHDTFTGLGRLDNLRSLRLDYSSTGLDSDFIRPFVNEMATLQNLKDLDLVFGYNPLSSTDGLEEWISSSSESLSSLKLSFCKCKITSIKSLVSRGIQKLQRLQVLSLDFSGCPLQSIDGLGEVIGTFQWLRVLSLTFSDCYPLKDLGGLGKALTQSLVHLEDLKLEFRNCAKISAKDFLKIVTALEESSARENMNLKLYFFERNWILSAAGHFKKEVYRASWRIRTLRDLKSWLAKDEVIVWRHRVAHDLPLTEYVPLPLHVKYGNKCKNLLHGLGAKACRYLPVFRAFRYIPILATLVVAIHIIFPAKESVFSPFFVLFALIVAMQIIFPINLRRVRSFLRFG